MSNVCNLGKNLLIQKGRWLSGQQKINPEKIYYMPEFKLGKFINSGVEADVFELQGYPEFVARVQNTKSFIPQQLRRIEDSVRHIWASNADESVTIMRKINGSPLHGKGWTIFSTPNKEEYLKTLDEVMELPDSAFIDYMDKLKNIRQKGYKVDVINPNNLLFDKAKQEINIIDIEKGTGIQHSNVEDFYAFVDAKRLGKLMKKSSPEDRKVISDKVKQFFAKIEKIGDKQGIDLRMDEIDHSKLQDVVTYIVKDDKEMLDILLG